MDSFKFREADELVSALQNDVEGIILDLREDGEREKEVGVPACFSGSLRDWYWLRDIRPISHIEVHNSAMNFYGGVGNKLICSMAWDGLGSAFDEFSKRAENSARGLRRLAGLMEDAMEDYGN